MKSPCYGCEYLRIERVGFSHMAPVIPFCNGFEVKLAKTPEGNPIPAADCEKTGITEEDLRGCCS